MKRRDISSLLSDARDRVVAAVESESFAQLDADLAGILSRLPSEWHRFSHAASSVVSVLESSPPFRDVVIECFRDIAAAAKAESADLELHRDMAADKLELFAPDDSPRGVEDPGDEDVAVEEIDPELLEAFLAEAHDLLDDIESSIIAVADAPPDSQRELIDGLFRGMHTLKGSGGMMNLKAIQDLAHAAEDAMDSVRQGAVAFGLSHEQAMLEAVDGLKTMIARVESRDSMEDVDTVGVLNRLRLLVKEVGSAPAPDHAVDRGASVSQTGRSAAATTTSPGSSDATRGARATIRVEVSKLDDLFARMGEMVIGRIRLEGLLSNLAAAISSRKDPLVWKKNVESAFEILQAGHEEFARTGAALQEGVMSLRLVPMQTVFKRFPRVIRETAQRLGKSIRLEETGAEVELDKEVAEALVDPLIHLVRNAIDHGIEPESLRRDQGKEPTGILRLSAVYQGDKVLVEIADDGRGIDPEVVARKAVSTGICRPEEVAAMSDRQKMMLILRAGFSTAETVTDLSGRGVGMDVVRTMVEDFKGSIELDSVPGEGTTVRLYVPLTLSIVNMLMLQVGDERVALPLYCVRETLRIPGDQIEVTGGQPVVSVRGEYLPVVQLARMLGLRERGAAEPDGAISMVVLESGGELTAIQVTDFLQKFDAVLKPLGPVLARAPFVSGATILGDGGVVPMLDPVQIQRAARQVSGAASSAASSPAAEQASPSAGLAGGRRPRVLVVDDSQAVLHQLTALLRREGYDVESAADGEEGLKKARASVTADTPYELISTDIEMPRLDGYGLARTLREDERFLHTPIIALTSHHEKVDRIKGFESGFDEYLGKPIDETVYLHAVARLLNRR